MQKEKRAKLEALLGAAMDIFNSSVDRLTGIEYATNIQIGQLLWAYQNEDRTREDSPNAKRAER